MKPAPALTYTSFTLTRKSEGAPSFVGSSVREYCVLLMHMGRQRSFGSCSYCLIFVSAASEYVAPLPPYAPRTMLSILLLMPCECASYKCRKLDSSALEQARITACPRATAPAPPCAKCSAGIASKAPLALAIFWISATSLSVSVTNRLIATTAFTPCAHTFLICAIKLQHPFSTRSSASSRYSLARAAPGSTLGAMPELSFIARTVQTMTAHFGFKPE
mmetsp:Transcript_24083/g.39835  ORF Transcript_24083/g.39835 Transcript_24083/m.39835 type:complete len:219 (-) Transcript_24083:1374-2030(-)